MNGQNILNQRLQSDTNSKQKLTKKQHIKDFFHKQEQTAA